MSYVTLSATNGENITIPANCAGVATGFGRIGNPYFDGDEYWRMKDGETVIECESTHPAAMPVADAYQRFHAICEAERLADEAWEAELYREDSQYFHGVACQYEAEALAPTAWDLIQDRLEAGQILAW